MTETITTTPATPSEGAGLKFVWLEVTGKCQLECVHCYADSGPAGTHGVMTTADWRRVIDQCAALGVGMVQFIGGEPTLHPDLPTLVEHALESGLEVEVFSNLVHVSTRMWDTFTRPGGAAGMFLVQRRPQTASADHEAEHARPDPGEHHEGCGSRDPVAGRDHRDA
ncbi:radical SAM protein [Promicromonospora sp. CA-289599]|uniref:radical SAM protein n=1 Tax=Promicromonospora sp. CA-289599 TaxID=3240014 RepID=UPI003D8B0807